MDANAAKAVMDILDESEESQPIVDPKSSDLTLQQKVEKLVERERLRNQLELDNKNREIEALQKR